MLPECGECVGARDAHPLDDERCLVIGPGGGRRVDRCDAGGIRADRLDVVAGLGARIRKLSDPLEQRILVRRGRSKARVSAAMPGRLHERRERGFVHVRGKLPEALPVRRFDGCRVCAGQALHQVAHPEPNLREALVARPIGCQQRAQLDEQLEQRVGRLRQVECAGQLRQADAGEVRQRDETRHLGQLGLVGTLFSGQQAQHADDVLPGAAGTGGGVRGGGRLEQAVQLAQVVGVELFAPGQGVDACCRHDAVLEQPDDVLQITEAAHGPLEQGRQQALGAVGEQALEMRFQPRGSGRGGVGCSALRLHGEPGAPALEQLGLAPRPGEPCDDEREVVLERARVDGPGQGAREAIRLGLDPMGESLLVEGFEQRPVGAGERVGRSRVGEHAIGVDRQVQASAARFAKRRAIEPAFQGLDHRRDRATLRRRTAGEYEVAVIGQYLEQRAGIEARTQAVVGRIRRQLVQPVDGNDQPQALVAGVGLQLAQAQGQCPGPAAHAGSPVTPAAKRPDVDGVLVRFDADAARVPGRLEHIAIEEVLEVIQRTEHAAFGGERLDHPAGDVGPARRVCL